MLFAKKQTITWFTADAPLVKDRTSFQYEEQDMVRLHRSLCGLAAFADRTDNAAISNVRINRTGKGDIFMGDVDYYDENGRHIVYTLNCVIGATHRSLMYGKEDQ